MSTTDKPKKNHDTERLKKLRKIVRAWAPFAATIMKEPQQAQAFELKTFIDEITPVLFTKRDSIDKAEAPVESPTKKAAKAEAKNKFVDVKGWVILDPNGFQLIAFAGEDAINDISKAEKMGFICHKAKLVLDHEA